MLSTQCCTIMGRSWQSVFKLCYEQSITIVTLPSFSVSQIHFRPLVYPRYTSIPQVYLGYTSVPKVYPRYTSTPKCIPDTLPPYVYPRYTYRSAILESSRCICCSRWWLLIGQIVVYLRYTTGSVSQVHRKLNIGPTAGATAIFLLK